MLLELTIENFAIIPSLHLSFHEGMTALTGETGAGKSIIIDAMGLLAGSRGSSDYIRQGADKCLLEGLFELPKQSSCVQLLDELGIEHEEDVLIVQRDMSVSGKSVCRVNGRIVTLTNLRRIGMYLVDIQGQNEHQELLQPERHLALVDSFGSESFKQQLADYQIKYSEFRQLEKQVHSIQANEQSYVQRIDMLQFQQEEIQQAELQPNEEEQLIEERDKLSNFQKILDGLTQSYQLLSSEESNSLDGVSMALNELQGISHLDAEYEQISENVQSAYYLLQEAASDLSRQIDHLELDEERLEEVVSRLETIRQLKRKYGESIPAILAYYEEISRELSEVNMSEEQLEELEKRLAFKQQEIWQLAERLHVQRKNIAAGLEKAILQELSELYMENAQFDVHFHSEKNLRETGFDQVEFYLTTNPGEPLKPLVRVASGGELSRILLALKTIFSKAQGMTSIVFDEVDTGVSGRVAQAIAEKIAKIATDSQVLCITHLPQVAAVADYQYFISKSVKEGRTETKVEQLTSDERVNEIARMLSGAEITDLTLEHARELLTAAQARE
ncbi:DNA repair protein RecN [Candidatus Enterococcus willemsii]|uniref:DNA repair protein RecN n=1 Tax=Candidatus Enterococcus willemsii TaxID=1857215 RepID=A0ABQ6YZ75_9ENTE|nr:DNA repair protein RecN [Enterococcus sp. CU12B]KAF1303237.1 DNA repair protein RecN [Enterococcus sp. CU12B]